jgi:hypothetical protein
MLPQCRSRIPCDSLAVQYEYEYSRDYKLTGRPAHDGLAQVDYSGRRSGALLRGSVTHYLRGQPRGLF